MPVVMARLTYRRESWKEFLVADVNADGPYPKTRLGTGRLSSSHAIDRRRILGVERMCHDGVSKPSEVPIDQA